MREVLEFYSDNIFASNILERLNIVSRQYFLVSFHREENVDSNENFNRLIRTLNNVADKYNLPIIVSTHPRTRNRLDELEIIPNSNIKFLAPFGFYDYIKLQIEAKVVLSDSGTITEESSILNFPALNLRESHERPEGFEEASVMLVGLNSERVLQGIDILYTQPRGGERALQLVKDYSPKNISDKVLRIIQSYTDVIRRKTWKIQV
jgi:UDP-N-acetylglucosamine 2-epimerase (non-hydrolysing)